MENIEENEIVEAVAEEEKATEETTETVTNKFAGFDFAKFISNKVVLIAGAVVLVLALALFVYLIIPSNRTKRAMNRADGFYAEEKFEKAAKFYKRAFDAVGNNYKAYSGYVLSKEALGDENVIASFEESAAMLLSAPVAEDTSAAVDFFLLAPDLYGDNSEKLVEILESAKTLLGGGFDNALADAYLSLGKSLANGLVNDDNNRAMSYFDKALLLSDNAESIKKEIAPFIETIIMGMIPYDMYEDGRTLLAKYGDVLGDRAAEIEGKLSNAEQFYESKNELLKEVYYIMAGYAEERGYTISEDVKNNPDAYFGGAFDYDWSGMVEIDGSELANSVAMATFPEPAAYTVTGFFPGYSGEAAAIYPYGFSYLDADGIEQIPYYFYYGDFLDGKREGYGITFIRTDASSYEVFEGMWKDDKPVGFGAIYQNDMYAYTSMTKMKMVTFGNFTDGLMDGEMLSAAILNEHPDTVFTGTYTVESGKPDALPGDLIDYGITEDNPEGTILCAKLLSSVDEDNYFIPIYHPEDVNLGVYGF